MEFQLSFVIIPFSIFILLHWLATKYYKPKTIFYKLPPSPRKLPLIGNLHQLAFAGKLPHHGLQKLSQKYGPLMHLQLGEINAVVVSSSNLAKEVMKTHDVVFANRPKLPSLKILAYGFKDIVFSPYGDYWRQMRKICVLEILSAKRVQSFSYIREDETKKFIESIKSFAGSKINLTTRIFSVINSIILRAALGDKSEDQEEFVSLIRKAVAVSSGLELIDLFPSMKLIHVLTGMKKNVEKIHKRVDKILDNVVRKHQEKRARGNEGNKSEIEKEDLVDVLLRVQQSGSLDVQLTINNIKAVIWDVFVAGTDTSSTTIEWAMSEMMKNPRVREKAQAELRQAFNGKELIYETDVEKLSYLKLVIKETLRLHPPSPLLVPRLSTELTKIDGYDIPKNTTVFINAWAIGRDPKYWNDAERFIPERFDDSLIDFKGNNFEYIPFGAGRRMCPGMTFGLASVIFPLALLLYHFNWELPNQMKSQDLDMIEDFGLTVGRKNELCLIPTVYDV
ncbi:putative premnaspirodiene oxygenase [Medicago truncatula]|uniref:Cytochrome P450 family 71 protein n=1 Tax=Medicago truncatula TaxID=3880 RepID=G7KAS9_MEDTR|nr:cytochrome P450 71D8 [Medicago truncatula]AES94842.1 cytochrome P450 family 71 protein [Medicago truncatula]RHN54128.1 putative premnaspirodiene oxygenase [Medicago truncatula]